MKIKTISIVHGGELASDVAQQIKAKKPEGIHDVDVVLRNASDRPKTLLDHGGDTIICFVIQTIENSSPTEEVN